MQSTPNEWKWRVAIFDDNPSSSGVPETVVAFQQVGIEVSVFGGADSRPPKLNFLVVKSATDKIKGCHILLVDIDWTNVGLNSPVTLPDLHDKDRSVHDKLQMFVSKIDIPTKQEPFPLNFIRSSDRGFWIAAAISHLAPHSVIGFYSQFPAVLYDSIPAALLQFSGKRLLILAKHATTGMGSADLTSTLEDQQREMISSSEDCRRWFFGGVVLMLLFDQKPTVFLCGPLWAGDPEDAHWRMTFENFFPQLAKDPNKSQRIVHLLRLAPKDTGTSLSGSRRALESVRHALKKLDNTSLTPSVFVEAIQRCTGAGLPGHTVLMALIAARAQLTLKSLEHAFRVLSDVLENGCRQLDDLCHEHHGVFDCDPSLQEKPNVSGKMENSRHLPFALCDLRRAVEALIDNRNRNNSEHNKIVRYCVGSYQQSADCLSVTYRDDSTGFNDKAELAAAVRFSADTKGLDRGLPLALSFAFPLPLRSLDVMLSDGQWFNLFPTQSVDAGSPKENNYRFGIRWTFRMEFP